MFDIIGDIHGHADELEALLEKLNYQKMDGVYRHPNRKVIFIGDYIDRGPKILQTLQIVKKMVDQGHAIALMGNHEYNALCYHTQDISGHYLRPHTNKNKDQHHHTLNQFEDYSEEWQSYLDWFRTLPLFYENNELRAVHACWDQTEIDFLKRKLDHHNFNDELLKESTQTDSALYQAIEITLKGKEIRLPNNTFFFDKDGHQRNMIRIKWWENPKQLSYKEYSVNQINDIEDSPISSDMASKISFYSDKEKPVFFGHYWLQGKPKKLKHNVICTDYSVAKGGLLTAFQIDNDCFIY